MRKNMNIGKSLGHIDVPDGILVQPREIEDFPDHKIVVISTGSQGEPLSALRRMAHRDHPVVELHSGDTIVFRRRRSRATSARSTRRSTGSTTSAAT